VRSRTKPWHFFWGALYPWKSRWLWEKQCCNKIRDKLLTMLAQ